MSVMETIGPIAGLYFAHRYAQEIEIRRRSLYPFLYHFFLSYTTREDEVAEILPTVMYLGERLQQSGFTSPAFVDRIVLQSKQRKRKELRAELKRALSESICTIALISPGYLDSNWCRFEWKEMDRQSQRSNYPLILPIIWKTINNGQKLTDDISRYAHSVKEPDIPGLYPGINLKDGALQLKRKDQMELILRNAAFFILGCTGIRTAFPFEGTADYYPRIKIYVDPYNDSNDRMIDPDWEVKVDHSAIRVLGLNHDRPINCVSLESAIRKHDDAAWDLLQQAIYDARLGYTPTTTPKIEDKETQQEYYLIVTSISKREIPVLDTKQVGNREVTEWVLRPPAESIEIVLFPIR